MWIMVTKQNADGENRTQRLNVAHIVRYWPATKGTGIKLVGEDVPLLVTEEATQVDRMISDLGDLMLMTP